MKDSIETSKVDETSGFKLELPTEVDITPKWIIRVSKGSEIHVYEGTVAYGNGDASRQQPCYYCYTYSNKTGKPRDHYSSQRLDSVHHLKHWLQEYSARLNVVKRRKTTVQVEELDEE